MRVDLDRDGRSESVAFRPDGVATLEIHRNGKCLWRGVPRHWKPWKVVVADVDGDGRREIAVGVHKRTRFLRFPHNCLFIYRFDGTTLAPKWLGSSLSKPFTDFLFGNLDQDRAAELVSLEVTRSGARCVAVYSWRGFGFHGDWQQGEWKRAELDAVQHKKILLRANGRPTTVERPADAAD